MRKFKAKIMGLIAFLSLCIPGLAAASGGPVDNIVIVADTRKLDGIMAWWANMYNESHTEFTILTVAIIPIIGVLFGTIADIIMTHIGLDLTSRGHGGH